MISQVISKIASMQSGPGSEHGEGLFLSVREHKGWLYSRPDNNIFGTASVVFLLNEIKDLLLPAQQEIIREISEKAKPAYERYRNKDGLGTYNFWETKPGRHFPSGYIFRHFDHFRLPDDIDDTALIYMNLEKSQEETLWLKEKLKLHTGSNNIYSTWFGKHMPHEQDICALCNLMYWIFRHRLPLNDMDHNTLLWMQAVIRNGEIITHPFKVARHYAHPVLILYHLARLMYRFEIEPLEVVRHQVTGYARDLFEKETGMIHKVLLSTTLWKLGLKDPRYRIDHPGALDKGMNLAGQRDFYSFIGALLGPYAHPVLKSMAGSALTRINWKCPAHELALFLENMVLTGQHLS